jgi:hypothetical protein
VFANARQERGLGSKSDKTEHNSSISGAPCETVVEGDGGRWWRGVDEVVAVVGLHVRKCEAGEGVGPKPQNRAIVARFRAAFEQQNMECGAVEL